MSYFYLHEGVRYYPGRKFTYGSINYTRAGATDAIFEGLGFTKVTIGTRPDERFYTITGPDDTGAYSSTARDLAELKEQFIRQAKQDLYNRLRKTDWVVLRTLEDSTTYPQVTAVTNYRAAARTACTDYETDVNACTDLASLITVVDAGVSYPEETTTVQSYSY